MSSAVLPVAKALIDQGIILSLKAYKQANPMPTSVQAH
jgi:hypothetical protein